MLSGATLTQDYSLEALAEDILPLAAKQFNFLNSDIHARHTFRASPRCAEHHFSSLRVLAGFAVAHRTGQSSGGSLDTYGTIRVNELASTSPATVSDFLVTELRQFALVTYHRIAS